METWRFAAAGGTVALHAAAIGAALALAGPPALRELARPIEVALIRPEPPPAPPKVEPPRPPEPLPVRRAEPKPRPAPPPAAPQAPVAPVVAARQIDEQRPAAITAPAAPPDTPAAPRVVEGVPAPSREPPPPAPPRRVGPKVDASWSGNAPPPYPAMARRMGEEGEVRLDIQVGPDGSVVEIRIRKSSGSQLLDQTAAETVKKWRFTPATVDGKPVAEWYYNWKWVFRLES